MITVISQPTGINADLELRAQTFTFFMAQTNIETGFVDKTFQKPTTYVCMFVYSATYHSRAS